ncbi:MAG: methionyl-tRNA formyltransferase [Candidatus Aminicenantales bacterium]
MKLIFFGTPETALPSLKKLITAGHQVELVVTQPDRPKGRGQKLQPPPIKLFALENRIPVIQPEKIRRDESVLSLIRSYNPEMIVVVAYGQILPAELIYFPVFRSVNVHFSLLPKYRGASPVVWAILNGEEKTGVTIFELNERMDEGDILAQVEVPILPRENAGDLEKRLAAIGAELLVETIAKRPRISPIPQDHSRATYAPKIDKNFGQVDWTKGADFIDRFVRALTPSPGAFTYLEGELVKIHQGSPLETRSLSATAGEIIAINPEGIVVACGGSGAYQIERVQRANRKEMGAFEFSLGMRLRPGKHFQLK